MCFLEDKYCFLEVIPSQVNDVVSPDVFALFFVASGEADGFEFDGCSVDVSFVVPDGNFNIACTVFLYGYVCHHKESPSLSDFVSHSRGCGMMELFPWLFINSSRVVEE